ncbi:hypothetical protein UFOVP84_161 [uncultured Caudovirales phage]|uniref:Putative endonuclease SegE-like GIY-YIG domain-containing protein n=1 Tax=uncultured Caudovirales phage TaxID=2100421 RepID=A0A6J5L283_9CAUD|nr:hypothetical protein UFOVP84_161 [uncultured Caudovirales phage]
MSWTYKEELVLELPECVGFVYKITNLTTGRAYIGKKLSHFAKTSLRTITLKSGVKKKKKIKTQVESDWKTYWSSSVELQKDVMELGEDKFTREILLYCHSKGDLSYREAELQFQYKVLEYPNLWYNGIINCKIHRNHLK